MNTAGDAAEQVVRMSLNGVEVAAKITGAGAKELAMMIFAILKDQKKTKGKTRLTNMLRSEKPLKVFAVKDSELELFCKEAKKYGVLYCVLKDKDAGDGLTDIMVRAEDASKINRIFERFKLATVDVGEVKSEIERKKQEQAQKQGEDIPSPERTPTEEKEEAFLDQLMAKPPNAQEQQTENPTEGRVAKSRQSAPTSETREGAARGTTDPRPSVREELKKIRAEQEQTADRPPKDKSKNRSPNQQHQNPTHSKKKQRKPKHRQKER